ncbi:hypothetical protein FPRO03_14146 [Fusarium proliferatum]|nr:hypothetical protein FPRO03_14146 [Fusarium proliferatum]
MTISGDQSAPLIVVVGATGLQGGSVINSLAASALPYRMRGLTRNATKPGAKALADRGIEVVSCNFSPENKVGVEDAFRGATYIFIVTNFWEHLDQEREATEGKLMVDIAKKVGVQLLIISSEPNATKASEGKITRLYHFDSKASIADHARDIGVPFVEVQAAGYMNNFTTFTRPHPVGDGSYVLEGAWSSDSKMPLIDTKHDFGLFVELAIESDEFNKGDGKVVSAYGEWLSIEEQVKILSSVTGKKVTYVKITEEQSRAHLAQAGMPPHVIDDMSDMFKFHEFVWERTFTFNNRDNLRRQPRTFKEYCENEDWGQVLI